MAWGRFWLIKAQNFNLVDNQLHCVKLLELDFELFQKFFFTAGLLRVKQALLRSAYLDRMATLCEYSSSNPVCIHSYPLDHLLELL